MNSIGGTSTPLPHQESGPAGNTAFTRQEHRAAACPERGPRHPGSLRAWPLQVALLCRFTANATQWGRAAMGFLFVVGLLGLLCLPACKPAAPEKAVPQFGPKEVKALEQMAEAGDPVEKYNLARKFRDGDTVPRDPTNAVRWLRKSAEAGYAKAQYHLGLAYEDADGVAKDLAEAVKWHLKAAEQDNAKAQERLGLMYWKGEGIAKDLVAAYKWLSLAAAGGEGKAAKSLKKLELSMTQQQVAEAKKQVAAFTPKKTFKKPRK